MTRYLLRMREEINDWGSILNTTSRLSTLRPSESKDEVDEKYEEQEAQYRVVLWWSKQQAFKKA